MQLGELVNLLVIFDSMTMLRGEHTACKSYVLHCPYIFHMCYYHLSHDLDTICIMTYHHPVFTPCVFCLDKLSESMTLCRFKPPNCTISVLLLLPLLAETPATSKQLKDHTKKIKVDDDMMWSVGH